jgi:cell wall-associated NlpC family hydrolase
MTGPQRRMVLFTLLVSSLRTGQLAWAQQAEARVGRFYDSTGWTAFRFGVTRPLRGTFRHQLHADLLRRTGGIGSVAGIGLDVTAFRRGEEGGYLVAGLSGGLGSERSNDFDEIWGSWSAGAGYDLFPVSFMSIGAEARWRRLSLGGREGIEVAIGLAVHGKKAARRPRAPASEISSAEDQLSDGPLPLDSLPRPSRILQGINDSIIATATEAMGRPYTYGGTGEDGEGFDCSGLIQYSYAKHGIQLPRRSTDQAREGRKIDRRLKLLSPADILTFSNHGGKVSHVGLYIGDGRFIHSATRGVQISVLSPDDPYGRWWYKRWVGVRRIVK